MYKKILVPLDGSKDAESVLPYVEELAKTKGAEIVVLRVAANPALEFAFSDPGLAQEYIQKEFKTSQKYIAEIAFNVRTAGVRCYHIVDEGSVGEIILRTAERIHADLIAMSTHGLSGAKHWILGSVAERIIEHSTIPVLLIRPSRLT